MGFDERSSQHDQFYSEVCAYLLTCGYLTESSTYHDHWDQKAQDFIRTRFDPTSLYVRFRADNTAVPIRNGGMVFQWDAKTNISPKYANMALEVIPLAMHKVINEHFNVRCLYAYYDVPRNHECGFWIEAIPPLLKAIIPTVRWERKTLMWFEQTINTVFPNLDIEYRDGVAGSNTPFVLISAELITQLPDWKSLIPKVE